MEEKSFEQDMGLADSLWNEFQYRHDHFWKLIFQAIVSHTALLAGAFFLFQNTTGVAKLLSVFPILAAMIFCSVSYFLIQAEAVRFRGPVRLHREIICRNLTEEQKNVLLVSRWTAADFELKLPYNFLKYFAVDFERTAKSPLASQIPVWWHMYGIVSALLVSVALLLTYLIEK